MGGNFWDGRATGEMLGSPAAEQAMGPFLNPTEQALSCPGDLVTRVCAAATGDFSRRSGAQCVSDVAMAYNYIGYSVAAYEASPEVNAFTSKFDSQEGKPSSAKRSSAAMPCSAARESAPLPYR